MFVPLALAAKENSAWASGGPTGGRRVAACLGRCEHFPQHCPQRRVQRPSIRWIAFKHYEPQKSAMNQAGITTTVQSEGQNFVFSSSKVF
jgi:hypothetical protein